MSDIDRDYRLTDSITKEQGRVFLTGTQALVRLLVMQRRLDRRDGCATAGFVSGYRGSPLAGLDLELWRAKEALAAHDITFVPGVNEDLAATAMMGTQQAEGDTQRKVQGVFGMWYGKGPGVDRAGDAVRHGNAAGASPSGGVLLIVGDDHAATSSSIPNASDLSLMGWGVPIVHPASVAEYVELGLWGWALSRFSGAWVALKAISETVESGCTLEAAPLPRFVVPQDGTPSGGLGYKNSDFLTPTIELRLAAKLAAVQSFARANPIDQLVVAAPDAEIGIVTVGKAHYDVMEVFRRLGLDEAGLARAGVRVYRPRLTFPVESGAMLAFARGLRHVLVVEEKASVVEGQLKDLLFNHPPASRPSIAGKSDLDGMPLVPWVGQLRPASVATVLSRWLARVRPPLAFADRLALFERAPVLANEADSMRRLPYFCSGCPHNSSTKVPEGSRALAGVGCHYMASWMDRATGGLTQMGGEGADWVGLAPFTKTPHVFQNIGEGTYFHSGYLAIRQAIAAGVNVTYKILFNDAVAMTGGQPVDGTLSVPQIARQMADEGAARVVVVTDAPERHAGAGLAAPVRHRKDLDLVQRELREVPGVTVLIYDQTCAAEKRRRRKRAAYPDPPRRLFINAAVCEGCGDCGVQSNCLSIVPRDTELGRKRAIDQSSCNKDYACVEGFCPSFVSVIGGRLRRATAADDIAARAAALPVPPPCDLARPFNLLVAGIGGTGVITVGALVAMAAHLERRAASVLDFTALAQKGGSVLSHVRIAREAGALNQVRIDWQEADTLIACDLVVACLPDSIGTVRAGRTHVVANTFVAPIAEFTRDRHADPHAAALLAKLQHAAGSGSVATVDAAASARSLLGDAMAANVLMLGYAWQRGWIPVSREALARAIELNGVAVESNMRAFAIGRVLAHDERASPRAAVVPLNPPEALERLVERRAAFLAAYQDAAYAKTYTSFVAACEARERAVLPEAKRPAFAEAVARNLFTLMAYKDEYEVARLFTDAAFRRDLQAQFDGDFRLQFHLAPPLIARPRAGSSVPEKMTFGPWMLRVFALLARLRRLRGTWLDVFGYTAERRMERRLIAEYRATIADVSARLSPANHDIAVALAALPDRIRGFGHVKRRAVEETERRKHVLLAELAASGSGPRAQARA